MRGNYIEDNIQRVERCWKKTRAVGSERTRVFNVIVLQYVRKLFSIWCIAESIYYGTLFCDWLHVEFEWLKQPDLFFPDFLL